MPKISILKVENPSCLWGRVLWGPSDDSETAAQYNSMFTQMNLFYHNVTRDLRKMRPRSMEEGQVCVVYWSLMKSWCRAVVESMIMDSLCCRARCLLVDHGERLIVPSDQIRVAMQDFLKLPFWVKRFHLAGIRPLTLRVSLLKEEAELISSTQWDSSATLFLHNLLQASTHTEAVMLESDSDSTSILLYLTVGNIKICVNDELVHKKFAFYIRESADGSHLDEVDQFPVMLSSSILTQLSPSRSVCLAANAHRAQTKLAKSQGPAAGRAGDWLTAPSQPQERLHDLQTCEDSSRSKVAGEQLSPGSQSDSSSDAAGAASAAAVESDSSEETDSSLAAALSKNLSLFRALKFLNPNSSCQQATPAVSPHKELMTCGPEESNAALGKGTREEVFPETTPSNINSEAVTQQEQPWLSVSGKCGAEGFLETHPAECLTDEETRPEESRPAEKTWRSEEDWACARLLEWLNPEPLNCDPDAADDEVVPIDPRKSEILVHSTLPVEPCSSLDDAPVTDDLRWVLQRKLNHSLSAVERYSWPSVARGCNTVIVSPNADQPFSYLPPLLTHILLSSIFTSLTSSTGPIAVVLCPGWEKVQEVYDLLEEMKVAQTLRPAIVLLGIAKDEAKAVKIPKNCLMLVTTPFSLVRLLSSHCFLFLRLYHLVLDEIDQLFTYSPDQMATILQHFQKVTSSEQRAHCPQQLVAVAKRWDSHMDGLLANHMPQPNIFVTVPLEAAVYGDVQQIILMTPESSKLSMLLSALDFNPNVSQKTLIVANSAQEVEGVFKAVTNKSAFCLRTHEGLTHEFDFVIQQWRKDISVGTHVVLVTTTECLKCLGIRDATCVVHYGFPTSPKVFGSRLFSMVENFRNLSKRAESFPPPTRSVLLISERNARHIVGILRYLVRTNAVLPPELLSFAQRVQVAREDQKTNRPLCRQIKSFGVCRDNSTCPDRHRFIVHLDQSELPASGVIEVVPLYIKTASVFYGYIVKKEEGGFQSLLSDMASYYADKKPGPKELLEGGLYAVQEDELFHRVKILSVPDRGNSLFFSVPVRFIDVGNEEEVKSHQLLQLPEQFQSLPGQAVEIIVCRVKPVDEEIDWHPKVTRVISQKIRGLQHRARAVFSLGNTVFVDPMVRVTQVPGMKTVINEYNVKSEILNTGMGTSNPEHLDLLKALSKESNTASCNEAGNISEADDGTTSLEVRIKAQEEVLAEAFRVTNVSRLPDPPELEPWDPPIPPTPETLILVPDSLGSQTAPADEPKLASMCDQTTVLADLKSAEQLKRSGDGPDLCPPKNPASTLNPAEKGGPADDSQTNQQLITKNETNSEDSIKSFHPPVRWYQTSDSVTVTVKLMNPESQRCDFHADKVVYSGKVSGQTYRADLELHGNIAADRCCWEMKSNEPVLKLVKEQKGFWERLLRNKNIFVSYDMEHIEEDEVRAPNGVWFVENTGEDCSYVLSDSDSDSD